MEINFDYYNSYCKNVKKFCIKYEKVYINYKRIYHWNLLFAYKQNEKGSKEFGNSINELNANIDYIIQILK